MGAPSLPHLTADAIVTDHRLFLGPRGFPQATGLLSRQQVLVLVALAGLFVALLAAVYGSWGSALLVVNAAIAVFFLAAMLYRVYLIDHALRNHDIIELTPEELAVQREWPRYVVQVPLYREPGALPFLRQYLGGLDYPRDRLTIQLLIEEDDTDTRAALAQTPAVPPFQVVLIPPSHPRTKPKACNVGLAQAYGDYLVIFDAEDRPEPDQLKKAVLAFERSPPNVACVQAKLNFYNPEQNLITRCFTAEYAMWFDLCLPGLDALGAPIPLGGTSNHFRLPVLRQLKGWDEYNVTEDCDLGLRLYVQGWRTRIVESTTWEEACPRLMAWIRQRSRWVKGYAQTYLVHTREPLALTRRLGLRNSLHFHLLIGGSVINQLLAPIYWLMVVAWFLWRPEFFLQLRQWLPWPDAWQTTFDHLVRWSNQRLDFFEGHIFVIAALCLFAGNFGLLYGCALACAYRGFGRLVKYMPLMPIYWFVMSLAAWKGTLQLLYRPHFWEKTQHHA
jgi:cellulose synthase/poly-beta-1,6-N-acetylglucosamine synthase-like glycosyltransferase